MRSRIYAPIAAIDIDGTLADYHSWFLQFAALYSGKPMPAASDINPGQPLYRHMRVSKTMYRQIKLAYRQGGMKRSMPAFPGGRELTVNLRKAGVQVYICTTRPYLRLDNIDPDTRHWLKRNGIQFDAVLFGERKYRDLVRHVGAERVIGVIDDLPEMTRQAVEVGLGNVLLRSQPYNLGVQMYDERVDDLYSALAYFEKALSNWKQKRESDNGYATATG